MSGITKEEQRRRRIAAGVSKMTPERIDKIKQVFALDGTIAEACSYAEISNDTYYAWMKKHPELSEQFSRLRERPVLAARQAVVKSLDDPDRAFRYLTAKRSSEFGTKTKIEHSGKIEVDDGVDDAPLTAIIVEFETKLKEGIIARSRKSQ